MAAYDFSVLEAKFPQIIEEMPNPFDSHEFLIALAHQNQVEYAKALYAFKDYANRGKPAPFQGVHKAIIQKLIHHTELATKIRSDKPSRDIFGHSQRCSEWQKSNSYIQRNAF